jgi:xanthine dehydrogenase molybdopterin-binding subunit B
MARVSLTEHSHYTVPLPAGVRPYPYFTYGGAVAETEVNTLTGDVKVLRMDVLVDAGLSVNPQVDIGQIEGGLMQVCAPNLFFLLICLLRNLLLSLRASATS